MEAELSPTVHDFEHERTLRTRRDGEIAQLKGGVWDGGTCMSQLPTFLHEFGKDQDRNKL